MSPRGINSRPTLLDSRTGIPRLTIGFSMSASQFASFAAYTPPPDDSDEVVTSSSWKPKSRSTWFPSENSYQSGGLPTFHPHHTTGSSVTYNEETSQNQWETRYGWRVDILAASAYILGPVSALALLILETHNDYVRFHAYQSALLTTPLFLLRMFLSVLQFPSWMRSAFTLLMIAQQIFLGFCAYREASRNNLVPFHAPWVGEIVDQWLAEE